MKEINKAIYFEGHRMIGMDIGREYKRFIRQDQIGVPKDITKRSLVNLLDHCKRFVPYYAELITKYGDSYRDDPERYLADFPVLTKDDIRANFERLKSTDLNRRRWRTNTSGGSTGEPIVFIQDNEYLAHVGAIQWLSNVWAGRELGEPAIRVWGSERDILHGTLGLKSNVINFLTKDTWFNGFRMTPSRMRSLLAQINNTPPQLIIGYSQCLFELAIFAEEEGISVTPQKAILSASDMLYPHMRKKIEAVFQCEVFDRYGSREVGDVACECDEHSGLHVFPWGSFVEIVDDEGQLLPAGKEGNILITSLANYAMPLVRYFIGDRGILSTERNCPCGREGQFLERIIGRSTSVFQLKDGTLLDGGYFSFLLDYKSWVRKFQVIQKSYSSIVYKIVRSDTRESQNDLDEIVEKTRVIMGQECEVVFEFVKDIPSSPSGKYLYVISEVRPLWPGENDPNRKIGP